MSSPNASAASASAASASSVSALSSSLASLASALPSPSPGTTSTTPATNSTPGEPIVQTQTPIFACVPASYNITGGTPPFKDVFLIQSGSINANILKILPHEDKAGTFSWGVDISPGTSITFVVKDSANQTGYSVPIVVQSHADLSCLPKTPKKQHTNAGAIAGGILGALGVILGLCALLIWRRRRSKRAVLQNRSISTATTGAAAVEDEVDDDEEVIEGAYGELKSAKTMKEIPQTGVVRTLSTGHRTVMRSNTRPNYHRHPSQMSGGSGTGEFGTGGGDDVGVANEGTYNLTGIAYNRESKSVEPDSR